MGIAKQSFIKLAQVILWMAGRNKEQIILVYG